MRQRRRRNERLQVGVGRGVGWGLLWGQGAARRTGGGSVGASVVMCVRHVGSPRTASPSRRRPSPRRQV